MRACKPCAAAAFLVLVLAPAAFAQQPNPAGRIKVVTGSAFIVRNSGTVAARAGDEVFASDALQTGADGSLGVTLKEAFKTMFPDGPSDRRAKSGSSAMSMRPTAARWAWC